uniref:Aquaporin-like protein n=1 Tax=Euplotes harpa TaxID=151035 RepID=A0A7S3JDM8_9SPIT|mmetsp:Transcript_29601/g.33922  ORF Transcript_29601/g.33922 Transcript_29601/m.33922 type:complete len:113 (+) Transcript_29601:285-623(+)
MLGFFGGVALKWYFDQDPYYLRFTNKGTGDNNYYWSEGTGLEFFVAVVFAVIFLTQTSRQTALSKDPGFQSFIIAVSYGTLVTYSYVYTGGSLNPAYAFAQNFWDQVDDGDH